MSEKLKALIEVSILETVFFIIAWFFEAVLGNGYGWYSKSVMIILALLGLVVHGFRGRYNPMPKNLVFSLKWSAAIGVLFLFDILVALILSLFLGSFKAPNIYGILVDLVWFMVFVGFAEELFFRGYIQERLNDAFSERFKSILGVKFEWHQGTLIAGVMFFGIPHLLVAWNPFTGRLALSATIVAVAVSASFMGVIWGVLKEKTGGVILPAVFHGLLDFSVFGVGQMTGMLASGIASGIGVFVFFAFLFEKILHSDNSVVKEHALS
ncbi:MAG: hypothetical protein DRJ35_08260 [Thermoprotei archaeon]|nr:MAG: hypothetical protein DRJ35_08260 [Thermoprotei archaeon]